MSRIIKTLLFCLLVTTSFGQVYPGDVNNDGIANNIDLLYFGQFLFMVGPPRSPVDIGNDWTEKTLVPWGITFPNSTIDIGFADCNGDGIIDILDKFAIESNYNLTHGTPNPSNTPSGQQGTDPQLAFDLSGIPGPIPEQNFVFLPINFGTAAMPVPVFSGIAFTINFNTDFLSTDPIGIVEVLDLWINGSTTGTSLVYLDEVNGKIDVAASRGPQSPLINSSGILAFSAFIVEEDVVGINDPSEPTDLYFSAITLVDDFLDPMPVAEDTATIFITDYSGITSTQKDLNTNLKIFPNPTQDLLSISTKGLTINSWTINTISGFNWISETTISPSDWSIDTSDLPNGIYVLSLDTDQGVVHKKVLIQR